MLAYELLRALAFVVINVSSCQFVTPGCFCWWSGCNFSLCFITCHKTLPATSGLYRVSEGATICMTASDLLMIYVSSNWAFCNARKYLLISLVRRVLSCWGIFTFAPAFLQHRHPSVSILVTGFLHACIAPGGALCSTKKHDPGSTSRQLCDAAQSCL